MSRAGFGVPKDGRKLKPKYINMKNETMLKHKSGVKFQYIETIKQQFSEQAFVKLLNLKSGKHEFFMANTYKQFFTA